MYTVPQFVTRFTFEYKAGTYQVQISHVHQHRLYPIGKRTLELEEEVDDHYSICLYTQQNMRLKVTAENGDAGGLGRCEFPGP